MGGWREVVRCLNVYLGKEGASAEASHKGGIVVHGNVCHGTEHCVDPVISRLALREGEVCDEPPLPHVVALRDHPKPVEVEWGQACRSWKGPEHTCQGALLVEILGDYLQMLPC